MDRPARELSLSEIEGLFTSGQVALARAALHDWQRRQAHEYGSLSRLEFEMAKLAAARQLRNTPPGVKRAAHRPPSRERAIRDHVIRRFAALAKEAGLQRETAAAYGREAFGISRATFFEALRKIESR